MQKIQTDILWLFGAKGILLLSNFIVISVTLDLLSAKIYGVWITLYTTISWLSFFDLGLGNGMRNLFAVNKATGNKEKNKQLISSSYLIVFCISLFLIFIGLPFVHYVDIASFFNISDISIPNLRCVLSLLIITTSLQLITKLINSIFLADQKPALSSLIDCTGVLCSLLLLFLLRRNLDGDLFNLSLIITVPTLLISVIVSIYAFNTRYALLKPSLKFYNKQVSNKLLNLGVRFFLIQLSALIILQGSNIIILKFVGPEDVSVFSLVYKYFNVIVTIFTLILTPYWSFFTDSYAKDNYKQLKHGFIQLFIAWIGVSIIGVVMWIILPYSFRIWLNQELPIPSFLPLSLLLFSVFSNLGSIFIYFLNGTSRYLNLQLVIVLVFAILLYPVSTLLLPTFGVLGVVFTMFFANSYGVILGPYLTYKVLKRMNSYK
ncbi:MAG: oligosaccharide flippase family protein [Paludibacteraceae bacterium]|jgi:O-antigen/teichoic acid export membrane protein|nr:oligosaccharide flippase family protein [Paludibacteraceae bacterium]